MEAAFSCHVAVWAFPGQTYIAEQLVNNVVKDLRLQLNTFNCDLSAVYEKAVTKHSHLGCPRAVPDPQAFSITEYLQEINW